MTKQISEISASTWFYYKEKHGFVCFRFVLSFFTSLFIIYHFYEKDLR